MSFKSRDIRDIKPKYKKTIFIRNMKLAHQTPVVAEIEININDPIYKILKRKIDAMISYHWNEA